MKKHDEQAPSGEYEPWEESTLVGRAGTQREYQLVDASEISFAELHRLLGRLRSRGWELVEVLDSPADGAVRLFPERHILLERSRSGVDPTDQETVCA